MEKIKAYLSKDMDGLVEIWNNEPVFNRNIGCFLNAADTNIDVCIGSYPELGNLVKEGQCVEITITKGKTIYDYNESPEGKMLNAIFKGKKL